jgi:hypothetical protein
MKKVFAFSVVFIVGVTLACLITYLVKAKQIQQLVNLFQQISVYSKVDKCNLAYFTQSPKTAVFELETFLDDEAAKSVTDKSEPIYNLDLFVVNAHLAKLYQNLGNRDKADQRFRSAMTYYNNVSSIKGGTLITNNAGVLQKLEPFDEKLLKRYQNVQTNN